MGEFTFVRDIRDMQVMLMSRAEYVSKEKMKEIQEITNEAKKKIARMVFRLSWWARGRFVVLERK
jgi:hypothetical protein